MDLADVAAIVTGGAAAADVRAAQGGRATSLDAEAGETSAAEIGGSLVRMDAFDEHDVAQALVAAEACWSIARG